MTMPLPVYKSMKELAESPHPPGLSPTLEGMLEDGMEVSLEIFLDLNYPGNRPDPLPEEVVADMPRVLFDPRLKDLDPSEPYYKKIIEIIAYPDHDKFTINELRDFLDNMY
jgi:hypothetical protein